MVVLGDTTANHTTDPLILTTYLVLRHQFRFKRNIERLYNNEKLSAREIAVKLGSSHHSVNTAIKRFKIPKPKQIRRPKFGRSTPNKSEAQIKNEIKAIALIIQMSQNGKSLRAIANHLNERSIRTPSGQGKWVQSTIKRIIKNSA